MITRPHSIAGEPLQGNMRHKAHLLFTWVDALVHHPKILDSVESILGPNLLCTLLVLSQDRAGPLTDPLELPLDGVGPGLLPGPGLEPVGETRQELPLRIAESC